MNLLRHWVLWVTHFSISAQNFFWHKDYFRTSIFLNPRFFQLKQFCVTKELFWIKTFSDHNFFSPRNFFWPTKFSWTKNSFQYSFSLSPSDLGAAKTQLVFFIQKKYWNVQKRKKLFPHPAFPHLWFLVSKQIATLRFSCWRA